MQKLLALNRGEIAIRILRAATELGLRTVAIYSQEDRLSLHRFKADEAYQIGEGQAPCGPTSTSTASSPSPADKGVDAIHPGYGFLSENPAFPRACAKPPASPSSAPARSCSKRWATRPPRANSRRRPASPSCPARPKPVTDPAEARRLAARNRLSADHQSRFRRRRPRHARRRAPRRLRRQTRGARKRPTRRSATAPSSLKRYIRRARHIEMQILGDQHGNMVHLFERDCSVQRRHQKVVEIAPALTCRAAAATRICRRRLAHRAPSRLLQRRHRRVPGRSDTGEFFFIEVNPRIQVEHTVTEMITGIDIVRARSASRRARSCTRPRSRFRAGGHCRSTATPSSAASPPRIPPTISRPTTARIHTYRSPGGFGMRLDGGFGLWRRHHHALLRFAAGQGHRLGSRFPAGLPPHGPRAPRVPHPRREDQHPVPRKRRQSPGLPRRQRHHDLSRHHPGAVRVHAAQRPRHQAAHLPRRDHRQRQSRSRRQAAARIRCRARRIPRAIRATPPPEPARLLDELGPREFAAMDAERKSACCSPTPPSAMPTSPCSPRACAPTISLAVAELRRPPTPRPLQPRNVGRRHLRRRHALPPRRSLAAPAPPARGHPQHLLPDAAPRLQRRRLHHLSRQRRPRLHRRSRRARASTSSASSIPSITCPIWRWPWTPFSRPARICEAAICYTGDILDPARQKYSLAILRPHGPANWSAWARTFLPSKIWPACCAPTPLKRSCKRSARGSRHPHSPPHP